MLQISVIIPTYNRATSLEKTLCSLLQQRLDFASYEIIIVDDGSTDDTPQVVAQLIQKSGNEVAIYYSRQQNLGPAAARNRGADIAQAPLILFFDDDVIADPCLLQAHLDEHNVSAPCSVLGYTPFSDDLPDTPVMEYHRHRWDNIFAEAQQSQQERGVLPFSHFITINLSVSRKAFEENGPFDQKLNVPAFEDTELGLRFSRAGIPHRFCRSARATHYPQLEITSLTTRRRRFGYVAGNYYLAHRDDEDMQRAMMVDYILARPSPNDTLVRKMRRFASQTIIMTGPTIGIATWLGQSRWVSRLVRLYLLRLVSVYWYRRGFREAVAERS